MKRERWLKTSQLFKLYNKRRRFLKMFVCNVLNCISKISAEKSSLSVLFFYTTNYLPDTSWVQLNPVPACHVLALCRKKMYGWSRRGPSLLKKNKLWFWHDVNARCCSLRWKCYVSVLMLSTSIGSYSTVILILASGTSIENCSYITIVFISGLLGQLIFLSAT